MLFSQAQVIRTLRCKNRNAPGILGRLATLIGDEGAFIGEIKTIAITSNAAIRDIDVLVEDEAHFKKLLDKLKELKKDVQILEIRDEVLTLHRHGKIETRPRVPITTIHQLRRVYTPGVATVSRLIAENGDRADKYTWVPLTVGIFTNGSRVLGLGNIGPLASLPVMEGKAALLSQLTGLNAVPVLINTRDPKEFVETVLRVEKGFGAIHLEDIEVPACFEIEEKLIKALEKPVMHDDQHGTAVAALAAILSACRRVKLDIQKLSIGQVGLGAAGLAISKLIMGFTGNPVLATDLNEDACQRLKKAGGKIGKLDDVLGTCDLIVATTGVPGLIKKEKIRKGQIILALSNPVPEIEPQDALDAGAALAADGRSVNNLLGYPGIWRGALDCRAKRLTTPIYVAAAQAIANLAPKDDLLPSPLDVRVHASVARAVGLAATKEGLAKLPLEDDYLKNEAAGKAPEESFISKERWER